MNEGQPLCPKPNSHWPVPLFRQMVGFFSEPRAFFRSLLVPQGEQERTGHWSIGIHYAGIMGVRYTKEGGVFCQNLFMQIFLAPDVSPGGMGDGMAASFR